MASTSLLSAAGDRARNPALRIVKTHPKSVMRTGSAPPDQILWPTIIARPAARPSTSTNSRSGGSRRSAWIVATVLCLRIIIASAATMQYSPSNFAKKIVSGDIELFRGSAAPEELQWSAVGLSFRSVAAAGPDRLDQRNAARCYEGRAPVARYPRRVVSSCAGGSWPPTLHLIDCS